MKEGTERQAGWALYRRMWREGDFWSVLCTAVDDCGIETHKDAMSSLDAFLQWFSIIPAVEKDSPYVMLKCDIDRVFHAFILNTQLYSMFCDRYIGNFVHHRPWAGEPPREWVEATLKLLREHFGNALHPELQEWDGRGRASHSEPVPAGTIGSTH
jgi:hypothetical protein